MSESQPVIFAYGGSFDPVHLGHLAIIEKLIQLDKQALIKVLPCATPALKSNIQLSFNHRVELLKLALASFSNIEIDPREAFRDKPSYTIDTLIDLRIEYPNQVLVWVLGLDAFLQLPEWHRWKMLSEYCHLMVFNRAMPAKEQHIDSPEFYAICKQAGFKQYATLNEMLDSRSGGVVSMQMKLMPQASSQIRPHIQSGESLDSLLPDSVIEYIRHHHLYESK